MNTVVIGKTKKSIEENLLKFVKRLRSIEENWLIVNDFWFPANRDKRTRPGVHVAKNPYLNGLSDGYENLIYMTCFLTSTIERIEDTKGRITGAVTITQDENSITLNFNDNSFLIASRANADDNEIKGNIPSFVLNTRFDDYVTEHSWTEISEDTLLKLKKGDLFKIETDDMVIFRLVRSFLKLRAKSERIAAEVAYKGFYWWSEPEVNDIFSLSYSRFLVFMDYGFFQCIHHYVTVPYRKINMDLSTDNSDLDLLFDGDEELDEEFEEID